MRQTSRSASFFLWFFTAGWIAIAGGASAQSIPSPMNLQRVPLFLNATVDPNVAVSIDNGFISSFAELSPYGLELGQGSCPQRHPSWYYWRLNTTYYNPNARYLPPLGPTGVPFPNASFNAAWVDGYENTAAGVPGDDRTGSGVVNLATQYFPTFQLRANRNTTAGDARIGTFQDHQVWGHDPRVRPNAPDLTTTSNLNTADPWRGDSTGIENNRVGGSWWIGFCTQAPLPATPVPPRVPNAGSENSGSARPQPWLPFTNYNNVSTPFPAGTVLTSAAFYWRFTGRPGDLFDPAYYALLQNARLYEAVDMRTQSAEQQQNFANWYSYYRVRYLAVRTALTRTLGVQDEGMRVAVQEINDERSNTNRTADNITFEPGTTRFERFSGAGREAAMNFIYRSGTTNSVMENRGAMIRAGNMFSYGSSAIQDSRNPYWEGPPSNRELTCRQNLHLLIAGGRAGAYNPDFSRVVSEVQLNQARTLPDGRRYDPNAQVSKIFSNTETPPSLWCDRGIPMRSQDCTLAGRIAFAYWATDLRPDLANEVPAYFEDFSTGITGPRIEGPITNPANIPEIYWNPVNDPATWQHMVSFNVVVGTAGTLNYPNAYPRLRAGTTKWPYFTGQSPSTIDDIWHSGVTGRGGFIVATDPQELIDALNDVMTSIIARRGRAAATTVTSGIIQSSTLAFRTIYDSTNWSGSVFAFTVNDRGVAVEPEKWEAGAELNGRNPDDREILTSSEASGGGVPFRWDDLPDDYRAALDDNPATNVIDDDNLGEDRLNFIRGDRSKEASNGGAFRNRSGLLGPVVNSGAVVVAAPAAGFTDEDFSGGPEQAANAQKFSEFRADHADRKRVIYVGAGDGMLHAFDAGSGVTTFDGTGAPQVDFGTGEELWAYIPREVAPTLSRLTNPSFEYTPYVDATPVVRDVFFGGRWRTLLVGSLRRGGQGIFALDITDPDVTESDADEVVLWEFSDDVATDGARRMGYSFGRPNVSRLANGRWVVVVSGGYNSEQDTTSEPQAAPADPASPGGGSTLFVLDAATGSVIRRFEFSASESRGLGSPTMGDYQGDFIDEFAVAGDLQGNLWRFDLSSANPASWSVERMFQPNTPFERPITSAPRLFPDPATGGLIAVFSTGKYLEPGDRTAAGVPTQRLYGVREYGVSSSEYPIRDSSLQTQTLTKVAAVPPALATFTVSNNGIGNTQDGWRINFVDPGERGITPAGALFSQGIAIFSTVVPNANGDPCRSVLGGNVYVLNAATGGAPNVDRNGDGVVTNSDLSSAIGQSIPSGLTEGSPAVLVNVGGGVGTLIDFPDIQIPTTVWRRRSWREIRAED